MKKISLIALGYILLFFLANVWLSLALEWRGLPQIRLILYAGLGLAFLVLIFNFLKEVKSQLKRGFTSIFAKFDWLDLIILLFLLWQIVSVTQGSHNFSIWPKASMFNTTLALFAFLIIRRLKFDSPLLSKYINSIAWFVVILGFLEGTVMPQLYWHKWGIIHEPLPNQPFGYGVQRVADFLPQVMSLLISPNYAGAFFILLFSIFLCHSGKKNDLPAETSVKAGVPLLFLSLTSAAIAWTYSRASAIAFVLILVIWTFLRKRQILLRFKTAFFLLALFFAAAIFRMEIGHATLNDILFHGTSTTLHQEAVVKAIASVKTINPIWGLGPGYSGFPSFDIGENRLPESSYFQTLQEFGAVGFALWLLANILVAWKLFEIRKKSARALGLFLAIIGISVIAQLLPIWSVPALSIWFWTLSALELKRVDFSKNS